MMKHISALTLLLVLPWAASCSRKSEPSAPVAAPPPVEALPEIVPVRATAALTVAEVSTLFGGAAFKVVDERNDPPAGYSTISSCRFEEDIPEAINRRHLLVTVRTYGVERDAARALQSDHESSQQSGYPVVAVSGLGDDAYIALRPAMSGGSAISFRKEKACFLISYSALGSTSDDEKVALLQAAAQAAVAD